MIVADKLVGDPPDQVRVALDLDLPRNHWTVLLCIGDTPILTESYGRRSPAAITDWVNCDDLVARARVRHRQLTENEGTSP